MESGGLRASSSGEGSEDEKLELELDYATGWFQYTASQRLTTFNFFLVVVGLLLIGYAQAADHDWSFFGIGIGVVGMVVSTGFLMIDIRNEVLVEKGLKALKTLEQGLRIRLADKSLDSPLLQEVLGESWGGRRVAGWIQRNGKRQKKRERLFKYRFWFRGVMIAVGAGFLLCSVWAGFGFPTTESAAIVNCRDSTVLVLHRPGFDLNLVQRSERQGEQRGSNHDRGRPNHGLGSDLHVQSVGVGNYKRVQTGRHCGKESVGGG